MLRSFFNAVSGMDTSRFWLDVLSDNLANANTVGFKASRPIFQEVISQVIVGLNTTTGTIKTPPLELVRRPIQPKNSGPLETLNKRR